MIALLEVKYIEIYNFIRFLIRSIHIYINQSLLTGKSDRYKGVYLINNQSQGMTTYHLSLFPCGHFFHFYPILLIFQVAIKSLVPAKSPCPSQKPLSQLSQSKALVPVVPFKSTCPSCPNQKHLSQLFQSKVLVPVVPVKSLCHSCPSQKSLSQLSLLSPSLLSLFSSWIWMKYLLLDVSKQKN